MIPAAAAERAAPRRRPRVSRLATVGLPFLAAGIVAWAVVQLTQDNPAAEAGLSPAEFTQATGIEVVRVAVSAGGGAIDLRYRVVDAEKAEASGAHSGPSPLVVIDESGIVLRKPFHAMADVSRFREGRTYYHLLVNDGGAVRPGEHVAVAVGHARLNDVLVR